MNDTQVEIVEKNFDNCKHIWMAYSWNVGEWDHGDFVEYGEQILEKVICQICLEIKDL